MTQTAPRGVGTLFLIPSPLVEHADPLTLPTATTHMLETIDYLIVENEKTARRCLKEMGVKRPINTISMSCLNEHTKAGSLELLLRPLLDGHDCGLMSEAGCPCVADPGGDLVRLAHRHGITVKPLVGPSSILLALMASGLNGQRFAFLGYLPADAKERRNWIKEVERESQRKNQTQIFMDTPYRTQRTLSDVLDVCESSSLLCVAKNLSAENESIITDTVKAWKRRSLRLDKEPAMFLLLGQQGKAVH